MGAIPTRADDERILAWVRLRREGVSSADIGARYGVTGERVRVATQRVRSADLEESGESCADVMGGYW